MFQEISATVAGSMLNLVRSTHADIRNATSPFHDEPGSRYFVHWATDDEPVVSFYGIRASGELFGVWSRGGRRQAPIILADAISNGATHLDCFDGHLVRIYQHAGFCRVTSLPSWTPGEPDVVYMALPGHMLKALHRAENDLVGALETDAYGAYGQNSPVEEECPDGCCCTDGWGHCLHCGR